MSKLNVLIVDHESDRGDHLHKRIAKLDYSAVHYRFVWGNQENDNPMCDSKYFVAVADVNFVHSNNTCAKEFTDFILHEYPTSWVVEYSGGGLEAMGNRTPKTSKHILYPKSIGLDARFENLHEFLEAVSKKQENAGDVLLGFNPPLEAKLELLHACLTPEGAKDLLDQAAKSHPPDHSLSELDRFWDKKLIQLNNALAKKYPTKPFVLEFDHEKDKEWSVSDLVCALAKEPRGEKKIDYKDNDCFDPEYMNALKALRDALLPDNNISE